MFKEPKDLHQCRDMLLPGLWGISQQYPRSDSNLQVTDDGIVLTRLGKSPIVVVSKREFEDGTYKMTFGPRVYGAFEDG